MDIERKKLFIEVYPFGRDKGIDITVNLPCKRFGEVAPAMVNWLAWGSKDPRTARLYAEGIIEACKIAADWNAALESGALVFCPKCRAPYKAHLHSSVYHCHYCGGEIVDNLDGNEPAGK